MMEKYSRFLAQTISPGQLEVPRNQLDSGTFQGLLSIVFGIAGAVAFLIMIIAGLRYILSQGDPNTTAKAKNTIIYAAIGLIISMIAFSIVRFVVTRAA